MRQTNQKKKPRSRFGQRLLIGLWTAAILFLLLVGGMAYGGYRVTYSRVNLPNLRVNGIAVGGLTETETVQTLRQAGWDLRNEQPFEVSLPLSGSFTLDRV